MARKPEVPESEMDKMQKQFDQFDQEVKDLTMDRMNAAPKKEEEPQTLMSQKEISRAKDIYLKPNRSLPCRAKFNERLREEYNFAKEYVQFIAENKEIIGESITLWTKRFPGTPYEEWIVPVNKPVWGPRYLAEQIKDAKYHRFSMQDNKITGQDGMGSYYGSMIVDNIVQRLDAIPVNGRKSVFIGAGGF